MQHSTALCVRQPPPSPHPPACQRDAARERARERRCCYSCSVNIPYTPNLNAKLSHFQWHHDAYLQFKAFKLICSINE